MDNNMDMNELSLDDLAAVSGGVNEGPDDPQETFKCKACGTYVSRTDDGYICGCGARYNKLKQRIDAGQKNNVASTGKGKTGTNIPPTNKMGNVQRA
ncbi:MAG: hypothetical protein K6E68_09930 [Lachnospiraceae bacterium]|nr:hypothetical protein [Lachnospiraceae bacterium]